MKKLFTYIALTGLVFLAFTTRRSIVVQLPPSSSGKWTGNQSAKNFRAPAPEQPATEQSPLVEKTPKPLAPVEAPVDLDQWHDEIERTVETVADADIAGMLESLRHRTDAAGVEMQKLLVRRWANLDAIAASVWAGHLPVGDQRHAMMEQIAVAWAEQDLTGAMAWLQELPNDQSKQTATVAIAYEAARTDAVTALELASKLPSSVERDQLLTHAVSQWSGIQFTAAVDWVIQVEDNKLRHEMLAAIAAAATNPQAAATLVAQTLPAGDTQARAAVSVVQRWAQVAPAESAEWVSQFPDTSLRDVALQNLLNLWVANDTPAAQQWTQTLPAGSLRQSALQVLAAQMAQN